MVFLYFIRWVIELLLNLPSLQLLHNLTFINSLVYLLKTNLKISKSNNLDEGFLNFSLILKKTSLLTVTKICMTQLFLRKILCS